MMINHVLLFLYAGQPSPRHIHAQTVKALWRADNIPSLFHRSVDVRSK